MKKKLIYYGVTGAANLLAIIIWFKFITMTKASFMPLLMFVFLCVSWLANCIRVERWRQLNRIKYSGEHGRVIVEENQKNNFWKAVGKDLLEMLVVLPMLLPFVFFFSDGVKAVGALIVTFGFVVWFVFKTVKIELDRKKAEDIQNQKELKEQIEREQSGYHR